MTNWSAGGENLPWAGLTNQRTATRSQDVSPQMLAVVAKRPLGRLARLKRGRCDALGQQSDWVATEPVDDIYGYCLAGQS